jgi:hypothetical protein
VAVRGPHHSDVDLDTFEPAEAVHPGAFDWHLAFKRHAECGEEGNGGWEVVDDDADMVHSLDRHVPSLAGAMLILTVTALDIIPRRFLATFAYHPLDTISSSVCQHSP